MYFDRSWRGVHVLIVESSTLLLWCTQFALTITKSRQSESESLLFAYLQLPITTTTTTTTTQLLPTTTMCISITNLHPEEKGALETWVLDPTKPFVFRPQALHGRTQPIMVTFDLKKVPPPPPPPPPPPCPCCAARFSPVRFSPFS